jgi:deoxycytidylate deaminase
MNFCTPSKEKRADGQAQEQRGGRGLAGHAGPERHNDSAPTTSSTFTTVVCLANTFSMDLGVAVGAAVLDEHGPVVGGGGIPDGREHDAARGDAGEDEQRTPSLKLNTSMAPDHAAPTRTAAVHTRGPASSRSAR